MGWKINTKLRRGQKITQKGEIIIFVLQCFFSSDWVWVITSNDHKFELRRFYKQEQLPTLQLIG